jgi:two-component system, OmpR family, response regulator
MKVLSYLSPRPLQTRVLEALIKRQFVVDTALSPDECLLFAGKTAYEALVIAIDAENYSDALILSKVLRHEQPNAAFFVLEQHLDLDQRLCLFDCGVDDCVHEPIFPSELVVRLQLYIGLRQAATNSSGTNSVNILRAGGLEMDLIRRKVTRMGKLLDLRPREFLLLEYLVRNANRSLTRTMILENVWHSSFEGLTNVVDVYISTLRDKVDREFSQKLIQTNRGIGYTFTTCGEIAEHQNLQGLRSRQMLISRPK